MFLRLIAVTLFLSSCGSPNPNSELGGDNPVAPKPGPSIVFSNYSDCKAFVYGIRAYCRTGECDAVMLRNYGMCRTQDCRAMVLKNRSLCATTDCSAYLLGRSGINQCFSENCRAILMRTAGRCS